MYCSKCILIVKDVEDAQGNFDGILSAVLGMTRITTTLPDLGRYGTNHKLICSEMSALHASEFTPLLQRSRGTWQFSAPMDALSNSTRPPSGESLRT